MILAQPAPEADLSCRKSQAFHDITTYVYPVIFVTAYYDFFFGHAGMRARLAVPRGHVESGRTHHSGTGTPMGVPPTASGSATGTQRAAWAGQPRGAV